MDYNSKNQNIMYKYRFALIIWIPILLISIFHYAAPHSLHWTHDILRRLYYIPIIFAAFYKGRFYTLLVAFIVSVLYIPHAFMELHHMSINMDPASSINKTLEIILYFAIGYITSTLSDRVKKEKNKYQNTAEELKNKLEEVEKLEEQLIQSGKLDAIGQMSAGFAHEIKNPISSIQATVELIEDECCESNEVAELIKIQKKELKRLKDLLTQFLNFAKPSAIENIDIDLVDLINNLMKLIKTQTKNGINFINNLSDENIRIKGDYKKLYQVFLNLILNSIDAIENNKEGKVDIYLKDYEYFICIIIEDNGIGIKKEYLDQIFNPFFTTKDKGTGLGLSIAFKIIEQHKGMINIESQENQGTKFIMKFPKS